MEREKVIKILRYYNDIDGHIAFARSVLEDYEDKYYGLHGGNPLEGIPSKAGNISNPTEAAVMNIPVSASRKMDELNSEIAKLERLEAAILTEICKLPLLEKNVLTYFYLNSFKWVQIAKRVNYSETQCKKIRNKALDKLGVLFDQNELIKKFSYPN